MPAATRNVRSIKLKMPPTQAPTFIILCAGIGSKCKSSGNKSLMVYNGKTIIEQQINTIYSVYPTADIIVVLGFDSIKMAKFISTRYDNKIRLVYNQKYEETGSSFSMVLGLLACNTNWVVCIHNDILFNKPAINKLDGERSYIICDNKGQIDNNKPSVSFNSDRKLLSITHGIADYKWSQIVSLAKPEINALRGLFGQEPSFGWVGYEGINFVVRNRNCEFTVMEPQRMKIKEINDARDLI